MSPRPKFGMPNSAKIFEWLGIIISIVSILSLFGKLGIVTFEEWLNNLIESYRNLVHPIVDFFLYPIEYFVELGLSTEQKDTIIFSMFLLDRYITDILLELTIQKKQIAIFNFGKIKINFFQKILNFLDSAFINFEKSVDAIKNSAFRKKILSISIALAITIMTSSSIANAFSDMGIEEAFFLLIIIIFLFPILCFILFLSELFAVSLRYVVYLLLKIFLSKYLNKKYDFQNVIEKWRESNLLKISKRQTEFNIVFIAVLLVALGLGRDQGWL